MVALIQKGGGDDKLKATAMSQIGEHYAERGVWDKAAQYFKKDNQSEREVSGRVESVRTGALSLTVRWQAECYVRLNDFKNLTNMISSIPQVPISVCV